MGFLGAEDVAKLTPEGAHQFLPDLASDRTTAQIKPVPVHQRR